MSKKLLAMLALAVFAAPSLMHAQTATANSTVAYRSAFLSAQAVGFGQIVPGTDQEVTLDNTAGRGHMGVDFNARSVVTYTSSGTLTQTADASGTAVSGTAGTILPTYYCAVVDDNGAQAGPGTATTYLANTTSTSCFTGNAVTLDMVSNRRTSRWIVVGGRIPGTVSANQPAGTYSGTVTISIARQGT